MVCGAEGAPATIKGLRVGKSDMVVESKLSYYAAIVLFDHVALFRHSINDVALLTRDLADVMALQANSATRPLRFEQIQDGHGLWDFRNAT